MRTTEDFDAEVNALNEEKVSADGASGQDEIRGDSAKLPSDPHSVIRIPV